MRLALQHAMNPEDVKIEESWKKVLSEEFAKKYFDQIKQRLVETRSKGKKIYPPGSLIFNAFDSTPFERVKAVVVGQDPYHGPGEAMGLCFSVPRGIRVPPSLQNIYKEIYTDLGYDIPSHGDLTSWTSQGVLLLNAILTVEHRQAASHRSFGWEQFTDAVIKKLSDIRDNLVFLLWGRFAQSKSNLVDQSKHHVLTAPHPSPLAQGFLGCKHFSKTNELLAKNGFEIIDWKIS